MKKFLVGIVTLVAAVMLSSPAFGAYAKVFEKDLTKVDTHIGFFEFNAELAEPPYELDEGSNAWKNLPASWGATETIIDPSESLGVGNMDGEDLKTGYAFFDPGVEILLIKWDGFQYGFLFDGYVTEVTWTDLHWAVSHADGHNQVPVPAAVWLLGSGVLGLVAVRRRRS